MLLLSITAEEEEEEDDEDEDEEECLKKLREKVSTVLVYMCFCGSSVLCEE